MEATCRNCEKIFESQGNDKIGICQSCVLERLTNSRPPEIEDFTTAAFVSREMSKSEWREFQAELRRYHPGDFLIEEDEWCDQCGRNCQCYEDRLEYEAWLLEWKREEPLRALEDEFDRLYKAALQEDQDRTDTAKWQAMYEESEAFSQFLKGEEELNDVFSPLWYYLLGWEKYKRFVVPCLKVFERFKKRWCQ